MGQSSKCLVIDADVARAASEKESINPRPGACRELLEVVRDTKHKVVRTQAIRAEWDKHQSIFTRRWLASMVARKQVCWINASADNQLRGDIEKHALSEKKRDAMLKDTHLVEAAMQADKIILSMDETVRHCFGEITHKIRLSAPITWVNPCISEETPIAWLQHGAPLEKERFLGYHSNNSTA